jgi:type I restriction enzyme M protein
MDLQRAKPNQLKMIEQMILRRGMILITRSGTTGRVVYATAYHDGAVGTEDVIRVVVDDEALRGYVYQFLLSRLGQDQLKRDVDGAIVDHIEAKDVAGIMVPVPQDGELLEKIGMPTIRSTQLQERAYAESELSRAFLGEELGEDAADLEIARARLAEIERNPSILVSGD